MTSIKHKILLGFALVTMLVLFLFFGRAAWADANGIIAPYTIKNSTGDVTALLDDGDVDGDIYADILVAIPDADATDVDSGAIYLFLGKNITDDLVLDLKKADYSFLGEYEGHRAGTHIAFLPDEDGDGFDEIELGFGEDTLVDIVYSHEMVEYRIKTNPKFATVSVGVGVSEDVDCSLSPRAFSSRRDHNGILTYLIPMGIILVSLWGVKKISDKA